MDISEDTQRVLNFLQDFCDGNLRKSNDIASLLEIAAINLKAKEMNDLIFTGASICLISQKIKKLKDNEEGTNQLAEELHRNINEISRLLQCFSSLAPTEIQKRIERIYLVNDYGSFLNIIDLSHDLSILKDLQNKLKREEQQSSE